MLNLNPSFTPLGENNLIEYKSFLFAGGEPHIKISNHFDVSLPVTITHRINSFNDLGMICITVDALKRMGVKEINLFIPYFPAARQDRVMIPGEPLSVKIYADIINAMTLESVTIFDPHSEVTPALLNNCVAISNHEFIKQVIEKIGNDVKLISPDGGALKKIYKVSEFLGGAEVVECSKSRDVKTGKLSGFKVYSDDLGDADCLIVDDICDGGGTFIGLAEALKAKNAGKLYLAISHGIFSKGFDELGKYFEQIFTTDSIKEVDHAGVTQIKLMDIL
ncbi:ribose-phosphate diphosphokinase [Pedobacter sp. KBS0701]|uniref:ribose-phosphate diphosphokinase n=1 Tax=unclassified Pedobacter TaxID=2628915 RepID=UPI00110F5C4D|nr:ribose-phosphate diphosphokinase [Pedobacter sp. KBS0701]QDW23884.1 ribose-phosphate pyrophosphokinase [Pedobacter sp. KBS0701]